MRFNKIMILIMTVMLFVCGSVPVQAEAWKWAYVDLQKAMRSVEQGKKAYDELMAMKDQRQRELENDESTLRKQGEELKKQDGILSEDARKRKTSEFASRQMEFQKKVERYEMELMKAQNDYAKDILADMGKIIEELGKKEGYDAIFERSSSSLLYAASGKDLTESIIKMYNVKYPHQKTSKKNKISKKD